MRKTAMFLMIIMAVFILGEFNYAMSATVTVTNTNDSGAGSLRQAIITANPGDIINFSVTGTITLTTGELVINKNLTITGPGALNLTISGNNTSRVFNVTSGVTFNLSRVTVSNGHAIDGGSGGGIGDDGGDGGGIFNDGTLTVTNVTFSGNSTGAGGGASGIGGGGGDGGGIFNDGTLTVTNVTFSGNSTGAGGSASSIGGSDGSGGGIFNAGDISTVSLRNTIVANSISGENCSGSITSLGHNLDSANACAFTAIGDLINADPLLGPLALNTPGTTQTHALLAGSPAIDAGDNSSLPPTDERGAIRIWDGDGNGSAIVDIGAYEYEAPLYVIPTMTEWGMIIFTVIAGLGAVYYLRRQKIANS